MGPSHTCVQHASGCLPVSVAMPWQSVSYCVTWCMKTHGRSSFWMPSGTFNRLSLLAIQCHLQRFPNAWYLEARHSFLSTLFNHELYCVQKSVLKQNSLLLTIMDQCCTLEQLKTRRFSIIVPAVKRSGGPCSH